MDELSPRIVILFRTVKADSTMILLQMPGRIGNFLELPAWKGKVALA